ncbi:MULTISPECIES: helix-turn-helix domain-containing protein [unclassified Pseudomonas]|uniref:winged helix-turn-helix transcriptional regulator n=1 Tax=unclassified Pseudomonas TaxID=196821 RepID=UPI0015A1464F|nr:MULTISPECIES: helix-turn-helix domain-containing protein [unclassified Pseudomonas]NWC94920.1 helix-turn-helix transcriptional regulator [Pseudomonas sp. IPO3779]NWD15992.1 helix-turn-helix transcriptional regulator [Pseudomonas sp. IPO3778]
MPHTSERDAARNATQHCDLGQIIDRVADKWAVMVIGQLLSGTVRFNELMRRVPGVSHRMLTMTLRGLQRDGIVSRTVLPTRPPQVEYALTSMGQSLTEPLGALALWATARRHDIEAARQDYDAKH